MAASCAREQSWSERRGDDIMDIDAPRKPDHEEEDLCGSSSTCEAGLQGTECGPKVVRRGTSIIGLSFAGEKVAVSTLRAAWELINVPRLWFCSHSTNPIKVKLS